MRDIFAANKLYASIDRYDKLESSRILGAAGLGQALAAVPDREISEMDEQSWIELAPFVRTLLFRFTALKGVGIAKATKILHLKRPHLFPVLDSFVVDFLTGVNPAEIAIDKGRMVDLGVDTMATARRDLESNREAFRRLSGRLADLPIPLTRVRMYDVLCWTQEKWVNRKNTNAEYGTAFRSI